MNRTCARGLGNHCSYTVIESDGEIISFSAWDSAADADAANAVAVDWVVENLAGELTLKEGRVGEILFSTALGVSTNAGSTDNSYAAREPAVFAPVARGWPGHRKTAPTTRDIRVSSPRVVQ